MFNSLMGNIFMVELWNLFDQGHLEHSVLDWRFNHHIGSIFLASSNLQQHLIILLNTWPPTLISRIIVQILMIMGCNIFNQSQSLGWLIVNLCRSIGLEDSKIRKIGQFSWIYLEHSCKSDDLPTWEGGVTFHQDNVLARGDATIPRAQLNSWIDPWE